MTRQVTYNAAIVITYVFPYLTSAHFLALYSLASLRLHVVWCVCIIVGGLPSVLPRRGHLLLHQCRVFPPGAAEVPVWGEATVPHRVHLAEHLQDCMLSRASDS